MNFIQENITLNNFFILGFLFLGILTYFTGLRKSTWYWVIFIVIGIVSTTNVLPKYLVNHYESQVTICHPKLLDTIQTQYIHVLGAGYSLDPKLPATSQLEPTTLTRLVEGIQIARQLILIRVRIPSICCQKSSYFFRYSQPKYRDVNHAFHYFV